MPNIFNKDDRYFETDQSGQQKTNKFFKLASYKIKIKEQC